MECQIECIRLVEPPFSFNWHLTVYNLFIWFRYFPFFFHFLVFYPQSKRSKACWTCFAANGTQQCPSCNRYFHTECLTQSELAAKRTWICNVCEKLKLSTQIDKWVEFFFYQWIEVESVSRYSSDESFWANKIDLSQPKIVPKIQQWVCDPFIVWPRTKLLFLVIRNLFFFSHFQGIGFESIAHSNQWTFTKGIGMLLLLFATCHSVDCVFIFSFDFNSLH